MAEEVVIKTKVITDQAKAAIAALNKSWIGLNAGLELGKKAAQALGEAYKFLVGDTMEYAAQVRQMMRISGQSAEMTSRMIQLTDDFALSEGSLEAAMKGAANKGIAFTVDSLAKLSDEYLALEDPVKRNTFLVETFGRAGLEMAKIMEKGSAAIIEQGAAQSDNLIMTQANLDKAEELRIAEDNLADSMKGIGNVLGNWVIPKLVDAANAFETLLTWEEKVDKALKEANQTNIAGAKSYDEYVEGAKYQAKAAGLVTREINGQLVVLKLLPHGVTEVSRSLRIMSEAEWGASRGAAEADKRLGQWGNTLRTTANVDVPNTTRAIDAMGQRYQAQADMIISANQKAADSIKNDISAALDIAREAADEWIQGAGGDIAAELENADLKSGDLNQALIILDGEFGTNAYWAKVQQEATKKIVDEYKRTGDIDAFKDSLQRLKNGGFIPLKDEIVDAQKELDILYDKLRLIDGNFVAHVYVSTPGGPPVPTPTGPSGPPPNIPGTPWFQPLVIDPGAGVGGQVAEGGGAAVSIGVLNLTLSGVTNARQFADALGAMANNAHNSGRAFQGG